jgi:molybdate transport system permease protein
MSEIYPIVLRTLVWAILATVLSCLAGLPLAYVLARKHFPGKQVLSTLLSLPLVLPPTAVGYLLLRIFADQGLLGRNTLGFDLEILFTWKAVVLACAVMSLPLVVRTARVAFEAVPPTFPQMARSLGYGPFAAFAKVTLPLAGRGLLAAAILGLTRCLGEFGATVILAGNIPGQTQTLSSALYSAQQAGNGEAANALLLVALIVGFAAVLLAESLSSPPQTMKRERSTSHD